MLESAPLDEALTDKVVTRFKADRDEEYRELLGRCGDFEAEITRERAANHFTYAELEENDVDLKKLKSWLEKIRKLDFYGATLAEEAVARLAGCETLLETYAQDVFAAQDENRSADPIYGTAWGRLFQKLIGRSQLRLFQTVLSSP